MTNAAMQWSVEKQQRLAAQLTGYWAADVWKIADCPLVKAERMLRKYPNAAINFSLLSPGLQRELKYVCWSNFTERKWNADTDGHWFYLPAFIRWLQHTAPEAQSLLEKELSEWESLLYVTGTRQFKPLSNRRYLSKLRVIYACLAEAYDEREEFEKDRWDARKLGNRGMPTACNFHLSFDAIVVPWLKQAAKEYCRYATPLFSVGHLQSILFAVKLFSEFARGRRPDFGPTDINRPLLLDFYRFITQKLKAEIERFHAQTHLVDIYGKEYGFTAQADDPALQVLKQLVDQRTLANGYCGIPVVAGPCPHPNKCLTCPHFRTDQTFLPVHERQLAETQNFIKLGAANQWPQMVQENQVIEQRLLTIITTIQARTHDPSPQHERASTSCASAAPGGA